VSFLIQMAEWLMCTSEILRMLRMPGTQSPGSSCLTSQLLLNLFMRVEVNLHTAVQVDEEVSRLLLIPTQGTVPDPHLSILPAVTEEVPIIGEVETITINPLPIIEVIIDEAITMITLDPIPAGIMMAMATDVVGAVVEATVAVGLHVDVMTEEAVVAVVAMMAMMAEEVAVEMMVVILMTEMGRETSSPTTWITSHLKMIPLQHVPYSQAILS
jgi:hypothetical protein